MVAGPPPQRAPRAAGIKSRRCDTLYRKGISIFHYKVVPQQSTQKLIYMRSMRITSYGERSMVLSSSLCEEHDMRPKHFIFVLRGAHSKTE